MGWLQASERPRRPSCTLAFDERVLAFFSERLDSGLKVKLEGQYGGLLVRFGEAVLREANSQTNEMRWHEIQLSRSSLINKNCIGSEHLYKHSAHNFFSASREPCKQISKQHLWTSLAKLPRARAQALKVVPRS